MFNLTVNFLSLIVYSLGVIYAGFVLFEIRNSQHSAIIKELIHLVVVLCIVKSILYIIIQLDWIYLDLINRLEEWKMILWAFYDWVNAIAFLSFMLSLRVFTNWKYKMDKDECLKNLNDIKNTTITAVSDMIRYGRRKDDF